MNRINGRTKTGTFNLKMLDDEIITGLLLSDGHLLRIQNEFQNSLFQISASVKHSEFIDFLEKYLNDLGFSTYRRTYVRELGTVINLNTERHPFFTTLRKIWYPFDKKIVPDSIHLTPKSIAYWFMGDGSSRWYERGNKKVHLDIATDGFDTNSVISLQGNLHDLGIDIYLRFKIGNTRPYITSKKSSEVAKFMQLIKPYIIPCFRYKLKIPYVNSKTGMVPFWKTDESKQKCLVNSCEKTAISGRKTCNIHKGEEKLIPRKPMFVPIWKIDPLRKKCMFNECIRTALIKRKTCDFHKGYTKKPF